MAQQEHRQIEDIIDARRESGLYDVLCGGAPRCAHSTPTHMCTATPMRPYLEGDTMACATDSEITLVRVKREGSRSTKAVLCDADGAIAGDGTHLAESPSLVNLVTMVMPHRRADDVVEYLVPLSSWEPTAEEEEKDNDTQAGCDSRTMVITTSTAVVGVEQEEGGSEQSFNESLHAGSTCSVRELWRRVAFWRRKPSTSSVAMLLRKKQY